MSQGSYLPTAGAPVRSSPTAYLPAVQATASQAPQDIEIRFDDVRYIPQEEGFFNVEYALKLPAWAFGCTVKLALDKSNIDYTDRREYLKHRVTHTLPSVVIPPNPARQGRKGKTGVNLPEYQAKQILWFMSGFGLWGKSVTAYLVVYATGPGGLTVAVSNPVPVDCPFEPAYFGGFSVGRVDWAQPLGRALLRREIPYEDNGCLLLKLDVFGVTMWLFHSAKKLIAPNDPHQLRRGVNCITYLDAAVGTELNNVSGLDGSGIAAAAGATTILENVKGPAMRAYFNDADRATWGARSFILWYSTHCVLIYRGTVCEYSRTAREYRETPVQDWLAPYENSSLHLARLP